jgi:hypothetical protein
MKYPNLCKQKTPETSSTHEEFFMPASGPLAAENPAAPHPTPKPSLLDRLRLALTRLLSGRMEGEVMVRPTARPSP